MRRMRIRTTEIEVDLDDEQVESFLTKTMGLSREVIDVPATPNNPVRTLEAPTTEQIGTSRHSRSRTRRRSGHTSASSTGTSSNDERGELIRKVVQTSLPNHERYNAALRRATTTGDKCVIVLRILRDFDEKELSSSEIVRILKDKFALADKEASVRMALMRAAKTKPPIVAPTPVGNANRYWLTADGLTRADSLLNDES